MTQNRRKFNRQPIQLSALVHPEQGRSWLCSIRDFCEEGMLLAGSGGHRSLEACGAEAKAGDPVRLHFSVATPTGQEHYRTQARIARILENGNGMGVSFEDGLDERAFKRLADFAVAAGTMVPEVLPDLGEEDSMSEAEMLPDAQPLSAGSVPQATGDVRPVAPSTLPDSTDRGMRDERLSAKDAEQLKLRITAVTKRSATRIIGGYVNAASEFLIVSARDAGTNAVQTRYLEALDLVEKNSDALQADFISSVVESVEKVSDLDAVLDRRRKRASGDQQKLELVDTAEFEQWLLVAELISKAENRLKDSLFDMRAQFGLLAKPWSHKDIIPVGPSALSWAFDDAGKMLNIHEDVRKDLYSVFGQQLIVGLENLYAALSKLFNDSGKLPELDELRQELQPKYTVRTRAGVMVNPQDYQEMDQATREAVMAAEGFNQPSIDHNPFVTTAAVGAPAYNTARSLLDVSRRTQSMMGKPREDLLAPVDATRERIIQPDQISNALNIIQTEIGDEALTDSALKAKLVQVLRDRHGPEVGLTEEDFDTLQVMENLVDSLATDQLITDGVRGWVRRLEVTLNKLATREPEFLASDPDNPHSAVKLLNQLARLGDSQDVREGIDREVGRRVDELLKRVVADYDSNPQVLDEVVAEMNPLLDRQSRTFRGNVERTVKASEGQQKLARARRQVMTEVGKRLVGRDVPELLLELLNPGWRNLLVHTHLRHGTESAEWRDQLGILDQVHDQLSGVIGPDDETYIDPEKLLRRVVEGLNSISFDPAKRTPLIMRLSSALVGDASGVKTDVPTRLVEESQVQEMLGLDGMLPDLDPALDNVDDSVRENFARAVERARRIQVGEWLATSDRAGRPLILSVAFVGDGGSSFVLVNRKGVKVQEYSLHEIADELFSGQITLLEDYDLPLMERASQRMLEDMHNQLAFQATHDDLTQLMNRREFERVVEEALERVKAGSGQHALLYFDLDQFKIVNNTSGHRAGDELLRVVGEAVSRMFTDDEAVVARLGGDEFGVLMERVESVQAREIAEQVLDTVRNVEFQWEGRTYSVTASMGLVFIDASTASVEELMRHADEACFSAKDAGRNRLQEYELGDQRMLQRHGAMEWVTRLDQALQDDRFILNCQKIVPIGDNTRPVHYEVLLTMIDELGEVVAPTELINAAETYNRMTTVDRWVISNVLRWMADNRRALDEFGGFAINVSGHSVNDTTFPDFVLEQFGKTQAPTTKVCFEITETAAIANLDNAIDFMNRMRIIGCRFSLDDFGTGLSSYSYLRNLPVDYVKIDGVFVRDVADNPADLAVVKSINEIGHYMGKQTIAEFVEDQRILDELKTIGVDYAQGYQISKPMQLADLSL